MPRSIFTKMEVLLRECDASPGSSEQDLADRVLARKPEAFKVFRRQGQQVLEDYCRPETVRRSLRLLADLGLVGTSNGCRLTRKGRQALKKYDSTLGQAVIDLLDRDGVSFADLKQAISRIKKRPGEDVPSPLEIYRELQSRNVFSTSIGEERFITLLNLLARCGLIIPRFRKFYWAP